MIGEYDIKESIRVPVVSSSILYLCFSALTQHWSTEDSTHSASCNEWKRKRRSSPEKSPLVPIHFVTTFSNGVSLSCHLMWLPGSCFVPCLCEPSNSKRGDFCCCPQQFITVQVHPTRDPDSSFPFFGLNSFCSKHCP